MKLKFLIICSAFSIACLWNVDAGVNSSRRNAQQSTSSPAKPSTPSKTTGDALLVGEETTEEEKARIAEEEKKKQVEEERQQKEQSKKKEDNEERAKMTSLSSSQRLVFEEASTTDNPFSEDSSGTSATGSTEDLSFPEERSLHDDETSPLLESDEFDSGHIGSSDEQAKLSSDGKDHFRDPEFADKNPYKKELSLKEKEEEKEKRRKARKNTTSDKLKGLSSESSEKTNPIANKIKDLVFQRKVEKE